MFCPVCRCEYREGINQCVDCLVPLVEQIPEDPEELPYELRDLIIFKCFPHRHEAEIAAGLLQTHGIDAITTLEDWGRIHLPTIGHPPQGVRLLIRESDIPEAEVVFQKAGLPLEESGASLPYPEPPRNLYKNSEKRLARILLILSVLMILAVIWTFFR